MDEFSTDDDDSQLLDDDFQDEYPFEVNMLPPDVLNDSNNIASDNNEQRSTIENNETLINEDEIKKILNEFNLEEYSNELLSKAGTGDLLTYLCKHWSKYVPLCYRATDNPTKNLIEKDTERILFKPLEIFICNNQKSEKIIEELKQLDDPPLLCGHVFKTGEPSYCCRDCGSDPTCVLCSDCFLNSKHRTHRYKMMTSAGGGGYCDCGDVEAWKSHPSCEKHTKKDQNEILTADDIIQKLPNDLVQRARQIFDYLFEYVIDMLCGDHKEQLPTHLKPEKESDDYITMLMNDEIHSYDQVTRTLKQVLIIDDKKSFEYATVVDREGRSAIKQGTKQQCSHIKTQVENVMSGQSNLPPLETKVMHHSLISHQYFAERIISWLQKFTECSKGLKHILCQIGFTTRTDNYSFVEKLMLSDSILWKSARNVVHQFFIAIYFMDTNWKKEFAILYTKNYQLIWRNYVKNPDDTISLTDLAVQLFTVLSLSKYLITNFNLLQIIMDTLIEQSKPKINSKGLFNFQRNRTRNASDFKRAQFIIFDFKYCLISVPDSWNDKLRESFLNGFRSFTEFIKLMHGMDAVQRYSDTHIEFEPEWETGFNLLIKLQKSTSSIIEWCSSDAYVLNESYKYLLELINNLETDPSNGYKYENKKFFQKEYKIIDYDITKSEVSIHAPLTRLYAALHKYLQKYSINYESFYLNQKGLKINELIEPSLRALAMVAQTNVGLWRRNGYSLISQVYFYNNVRCRLEMFDRDLECMQMGSSIMEPNEFIVTILSRFRLIDFWAKDNPEGKTDDTKLEYLNILAEEFLQLLIMIIGERYETNIGLIDKKEKIKREVIHQLCISPLAHSDIIKNIYGDNEINVNELEEVLREIAVFKTSTNQSAKGTYELKPIYFDYYNPYFYHYSRIEKTKSEEYVLKKKSEDNRFLLPCVPPLFTQNYIKIRNLLDSDVMIKIMSIVIKRYFNKSKSCTDGQLVRVLHLIGMALNEEKQKLDYETNHEFKFCEKISKQKTNVSLITDLKIAIPIITTPSYKLLGNWILQQLENLCKNVSSIKSNDTSLSIEGTSDVLKMKTAEEDAKTQLKEKRKSQIKVKAEERRAKILAQMSEMQKDFIKKNKDFFEETSNETEIACASSIVEMDLGYDQKNIVCLGPNQTQVSSINSAKVYRCILCQEDQEISLKNPPMVLCAYIQHSKVLSKEFKRNIENIDKFDPLFMPNSLFWGINTTSCGHVMHGTCWQKYVDGVRANEHRRHGRIFNVNIKRNEFLCPLCETIGNTVLPVLPNFKEITNQSTKVIDITFDDWLDGLKNTLDFSIQKELNDDKDVFMINPFPLSSITKFMAEAVARNFNLLFSYGSGESQSNEPKILEETLNIFEIFSRSAFVFGMIAHPNDDDPRMAITTWNNCAYTIQVMEQIFRLENKPIFSQLPARQSDLLSNLIKFASMYAIAKNMKHVREYCFKILAAILPYNSVLFDTINIIDCDIFHLLVYLCFSMPYLYDNTTLSSIPCGNINEAYIFKLMLQVHCVQIILKKIQFNSFYETTEFYDLIESNSTNNEQDLKIYDLFEYILNISKIQNENFVKPLPKTVTQSLKMSLMPFLRSCVLFFKFMTDIQPPSSEYDVEMDTYNYFCNYLGISKDISVLLDLNNLFFKESVTKWCTINANIKEKSTVVVDYPLKINQLTNLPNDYIDLISSFSKLSSSLTEPDSASILCLICGEALSNKSYNLNEEIGSSRVGSCTAHAYKCGKTVGIFLRIAECQILMLHLNVNAENEILVRGSFIPAPYLDDYGETDQGLRRGNPLRLCTTRYEKLHKILLTHSIPNEISRSYQNNQTSFINVDWMLF